MAATSVAPLSQEKRTGTAVAGAVTLHATVGVVTTESLTTAQNADYTLTITNNRVDANSVVVAAVANKTNSAGSPVVRTVAVAANTLTIVIRNIHASAVAFNGTLDVHFAVIG